MPMGIIDDDPELWGDNIRGVKVYPPDRIDQLLELGTRDIFLALPSVSRSRRLGIIDRLRDYDVRVSTIPDLEELVAGSARFDEIRPILIEDLLGREPVKPDTELLGGCTRAKSVLVTGAGGCLTALDGSDALHADGMLALGDPALLEATLSRLAWPSGAMVRKP